MSEENQPQCFLSFIITGICGFNIKKGNLFFASHPYVKLKLLPGNDGKKHPHHKQNFRTKRVENTTNPTWKEQFYIQVLRGDILEFQVKSEQEAFSQFLGKIQVPVTTILERLKDCEHRYTSALSKRNYMDTTSGSLSFVIADGRSSLFKTIHESMDHRTSPHNSTTPSSGSSGGYSTTPSSSNRWLQQHDTSASNGNCQHHVTTNDEGTVPPTTTDSSTSEEETEDESTQNPTSTQQLDDDDDEIRIVDEEEISFERDVMNGVTRMLNKSSLMMTSPHMVTSQSCGDTSSIQQPHDDDATSSGQTTTTTETPPSTSILPTSTNNNEDMLKLLRYLSTIGEHDDTTNHLEKMELIFPRRDKSANLGFDVIGGSDCKNLIIRKGIFVIRMQDDSEAYKHGMKLFDEIIEIDGCMVNKCQIIDTLLTTPEISNFLQPVSNTPILPVTPLLSATPLVPTTPVVSETPVISDTPVISSTSLPVEPSTLGSGDTTQPNTTDNNSVCIKILRRVTINNQHQVMLKPKKKKEIGKIRRISSCPNIHLQKKFVPDIYHHRTSSNELVAIQPPHPHQQSNIFHPLDGSNEQQITTTRKLLRSFNNSRKAVSRVYSCEHPSAEEPSQKDLPSGWEACQDRFGRIYYLDHENRVTQWEKPGTSSVTSVLCKQQTLPSTTNRMISTHQHQPYHNHHNMNIFPSRTKQHRYHSVKDDRNYQRVMKRYQSIRRVIRPQLIEERNNGGATNDQQNTSRPTSDSSSPANSPPIIRRVEESSETPNNNKETTTQVDEQQGGGDVRSDDVSPLTIVNPPVEEEQHVDDIDGPTTTGTPPTPIPRQSTTTTRNIQPSAPQLPSTTTETSTQPRSPRQQQRNQQQQIVRGRNHNTTTTTGRLTTSSTDHRLATDHRLDYLYNPAFKFLTHPDFNKYLQENYDAFILFNTNTGVRYMIKKINKDKNTFVEYQHNKELVKFVNYFVDTSKQLPHGWEQKTSTSTGKRPFFVNHNDRFTTFFDPRLPTTPTHQHQLRHQQQPAAIKQIQLPKETRAPVQSPIVCIPPSSVVAGDNITTTPSSGNNSTTPPSGNNSTAPSGGDNTSAPSSGEQPPEIAPRPNSTLTPRSRIIEQRDNDVTTMMTSPPPPSRDDVIPATYNDKVVAFLKQANIVEIIKERYPQITSSQPLNYKINKIKQEGLAALERFTNSLQLNIMLSLFEEEIMSFVVKDQSVLAERPSINRGGGGDVDMMTSSSSRVTPSPRSRPILRNFNSKLRSFYRKLEQKGYGQGPGKLKLVVNRDNLLEDAYRKIINIERKQLQRCKFFVSFNGEEGLDYSGPSREFFFLISRELFNPYYGLFEYSAVDTYTVQISPLSAAFVDSPLQWFQFAGRIIGLALIHHCLLDAFFARPLYKMLLRSKCSLPDLRYIDEEFYQSMTWMQDNDITDLLDLDYTVDEEKFGKTETVELKPNGRNIPVTERNKKEYIDKMVKWRVERGIKEQTNMLIRGFNEVIDLRLVSVFDAKELELVICGTADIDLSDWRSNTEYRGGYHDNHQVIVNFWSALQNFDNERRLRLLQFVTGTSSVPYEGFAALRGPNGPKKFCIEKWGSPASLPRAHTCFNRIDLPPYTSFELLWEKLVIAVEESSTFAME